jgi:hypothetical protein
MAKMKEVTINGQRYQLRKLLPDAGSYIYMKMMGALLSAAAESNTPPKDPDLDETKPSEDDKARMLCSLAFMRGMTYEDMKFAQRQCMQTTSRVEPSPSGSDIVIPIMNDSGRWAIPEVAEDIALVNAITTESLVFSLSSFFLDRPLATTPTAG